MPSTAIRWMPSVILMNRRDLLLEAMGISQWQLRRPHILQGAIGITVAGNIRLIVVSDTVVSGEPLLTDILRAIDLNAADCLCLNFDQIQHIHLQHSLQYCLFTENSEKIDRTLPYCINAEKLYRTLDWPQFKLSSQAKRDFWRQIQQN